MIRTSKKSYFILALLLWFAASPLQAGSKYTLKPTSLEETDQFLKERNCGSYVEVDLINTVENKVDSYVRSGPMLFWADKVGGTKFGGYHGIIEPIEPYNHEERKEKQKYAHKFRQPHLEFINILPSKKKGYAAHLYMLIEAGSLLLPHKSAVVQVNYDESKKIIDMTFTAHYIDLSIGMQEGGRDAVNPYYFARTIRTAYDMKGRIRARLSDEKKVHGIYKTYGWEGEDN